MSEKNTYREFDKDALFAIMSETERLANVGGWMWDVTADVWTFSDNWLRIHGYTDQYLSTSELMQLAHPDDVAEIQHAFDQAITKGINYNIQHRIILQDTGEERYIRACGKCRMDADGNVVKLFGSSQDITEQKKAASELKRNKDRLLLALESADEGIWEWDLKNHKVFFDTGALKMLGYTETDFNTSQDFALDLI